VRPREDDELIQAAAHGDESAFAEFYRRWLPVVVGYHLRRTGDREVAFDLTAETFAAVVAGCPDFDPHRGPAAGWLFGIAENKLLNSLRRARVEVAARERLRFEPIAITDDDLERVDTLASLGDEDLLGGLLGELPAEQQVAIRARVLDERPYPAIAAELRCSEAVVRQRVHRGLGRMRQRLQEMA
jgi:RNA polymerase sigma-70 factor (ECF subfamily)